MGAGPDDEALWAFVAAAPTGIVTTLTPDGWPVTLPTWFVVLDRVIWFRTAARARKLRRIAADRRGSFLVEEGIAWPERRAVHLRVEMTVPGDAAMARAVDDALARKYADHGPPGGRPGDVVVRAMPVGTPIWWDNAPGPSSRR